MYRNVMTEMSPDRNCPDRNGSRRNSHTEKSCSAFENWTMSRWKKCHQS